MNDIDLLWEKSVLEVELKKVEKGIKDYYIFGYDTNVKILREYRYNLNKKIDEVNQKIIIYKAKKTLNSGII